MLIKKRMYDSEQCLVKNNVNNNITYKQCLCLNNVWFRTM